MRARKKKPRATPVNGDGWIRFPRDLRIEGKCYVVEELRRKSGSWIACGTISEVSESLTLVA